MQWRAGASDGKDGPTEVDRKLPWWSLPAFFGLLVGVLAATCCCALVDSIVLIASLIAVMLVSLRLIMVAIAIPILCVWNGMTGGRGSHHLLIVFACIVVLWCAIVLVRSTRKALTARSRNYTIGWCLCSLALVCSLPLSGEFINARLLAGFSGDQSRVRELSRALVAYSDDHSDNFPNGQVWRKEIRPYISGYYSRNGGGDPTIRPANHGEGALPDSQQYIYVQPPSNCDYPQRLIMLKAPGWEKEIGLSLFATASGEVVTKRVWPWWRYAWEGLFDQRC